MKIQGQWIDKFIRWNAKYRNIYSARTKRDYQSNMAHVDMNDKVKRLIAETEGVMMDASNQAFQKANVSYNLLPYVWDRMKGSY
jgi:hypothetical protein